jgi:type IV pilus assembly protein PilB
VIHKVRRKLGECLIQAGLITQEDLQTALTEQRRTGERIGAVFVRLNLATEKQVTKALAHQIGLPYISLPDDPPDRSAIVLIPREIALARVCIAIRRERNLLTVATADPLSISLASDLEALTGHSIRQVVATATDIRDAIASGYVAPAAGIPGAAARALTLPAIASNDPESTSVEAPAAESVSGDENALEPTGSIGRQPDSHSLIALDDLLALIVKRAIASGATDLHIDPREHCVTVRHRIDGVLAEPLDLPQWAHEVLVAHIKQLAGLDLVDSRPQDGRARVHVGGADVEFRAATLRTVFGDKVVLHFLGLRKAPLPLDELGLPAGAIDVVRDWLCHSHGLIVVAGPSLSGRTTTLASAVSSIEAESRNIVTIEGAIEYLIGGANQTQPDDTAGLTTAARLDAILQQDPDVLLIGDLAGPDTVKIAMQAAEKRQLVLAGLHADGAPSTVTRLAEMAVNTSLVGSALIGVIAQRLVRRLCGACRRQYTPDGETLRGLSIPEASAAEMVFYHAVGCEECHQTGYKGRIAVFEVMKITDRLRRLIAQGAGEDLVREAAIDAGMVPLGEDGLAKVKAGVTTADELQRVLTRIRNVPVVCPACGGAVAIEFNVCPKCAHRLIGGCHKCGRGLQPEWDYCPYCAATTHKKKKKSKEHKAVDLPGSNVAEFKNQNR